MVEKNESIVDYSKADVKVIPPKIKGVIISIDIVTAKSIFGVSAKRPDSNMFQILIENKEFDIKTEDSISYFEKGSVIPDNSKFGKFLLKYDSFKVGLEVDLIKNEDGFFKIGI